MRSMSQEKLRRVCRHLPTGALPGIRRPAQAHGLSLNLQRVFLRKSFYPAGFLVVIAICISLVACGGNGRSAAPSPPAVSLSPAPSAGPADLALAARLYS